MIFATEESQKNCNQTLRYAQGDKVNVILRNEVTKNLELCITDG